MALVPPRPINVPARPCEIESSENDRFSFLTSMNCPGDGQSCGMLMPGDRSHNTVNRSGSGYGSGLSKSALTTLKTAVFAPIPIASDATIDEGQASASLERAKGVSEVLQKIGHGPLDAGVDCADSTYGGTHDTRHGGDKRAP